MNSLEKLLERLYNASVNTTDSEVFDYKDLMVPYSVAKQLIEQAYEKESCND